MTSRFPKLSDFGQSPHVHFYIAPRYTVGSARQVQRHVALRIAREERDVYADMLSGIHGEKRRKLAEERGLRGIVEERWEFRGKLFYRDELTGDHGLLEPAAKEVENSQTVNQYGSR
jgi:hypothetical protein